MKSKQTAVEWLLNQILFLDWNHLQGSKKLEIFEQAKQMEKEQIIKANRDGVDMVLEKKYFISGEKYYKQTYGK